MSCYIDIHCHILPGIDDGAHSLEESIAMAKKAVEDGVRAVIATPHQKPDRRCEGSESVQKRTEQLQKVLDGLQVPLKLYPGGEVLYSHDMVRFLDEKKAGVLANSRYVLTEFLPDQDWGYIYNGLYDLLGAGYRPVIAHMERYANVICDLNRVEQLRESGCLVQINGGSLTGFGGSLIKRTARKLIREELADLVATDAHHANGGRKYAMGECAEWLKRKCRQEYAEKLLYRNAEQILRDEEIIR